MSSILPQGIVAATKVDPTIALFYGPPKIGKTGKIAELPETLLLDLEKGTEMIGAQKIHITSLYGTSFELHEDGPMKGQLKSASLDKVINEIRAYAMAEKTAGRTPKAPYRRGAIDTIDKLEEWCEMTATAKYKASAIGKTFQGDSVLELPNGGGYYHLRQEVLHWINRLLPVFPQLLLVSHIREKNINKGGVDVSVKDISLTGKLGSIICAQCDLVGYVYREPGKSDQLMVSFETQEGSTMGARIPHLAGKRIPFDWTQIYTQG